MDKNTTITSPPANSHNSLLQLSPPAGKERPSSPTFTPHSKDRQNAITGTSKCPPATTAYYLPGTPAEMFLYPMESIEAQKQREMGNERRHLDKSNDGDTGDGESEEGEESAQKGDRRDALRANRRRTGLYRTLVWLQFSFTMFTCVFILIIMTGLIMRFERIR
uniref:Uncharacterized protein n=1 Tax=Globodera rostochiensis TaxID=31243 RepID=A0A914H3G9_GLORO